MVDDRLRCFCDLFPLFHVNACQVLASQVSLKQSYGQFSYGHGEADDGNHPENVKRSGGEVKKVERGVEEFVSGAHREEHGLARVVKLHDGVS